MIAHNCATLCDMRILVDQAAKRVPPRNARTGCSCGWMDAPGRVLLQRPVRPVVVEVIDILAEDQLQMPFAGDQHPVQALAAGAYPALGDRVGPPGQQHLIQMIGTDVCR